MILVTTCLSTEWHNLLFINYNVFQAEVREIGDAHGRFQVPPLDELLNATINEPLDWDPVVNFRKPSAQTDAPYKEQHFSIKCALNKSIHI